MYIDLLNIGKNKKSESSKINSNVSTSALENGQPGICPKCKKSMSTAAIASSEPVFYCESCRVCAPLPNK